MKILKQITISVVALCLSLAGFAYTISYEGNTVNVGQLDTQDTGWFGSLPNYNPQTEANWVNGILGTSYSSTDVTKEETVQLYTTNESTDVFAFKLNTEPGYYLIKNGSGKSADYSISLFFNEQNTHWGVLSYSYLDDHGFKVWGNDLTISHVSEFGSAVVPEPATLVLLALGLFGLGAARHRVRCA